MKNIKIVLIVIALFTVFSSNAQSKNKDHFTVQVDGLGCPFCAFGLEKKFQKLDGISDIKIDIEKGILDFDFIMEKALTLEEVKYQVESSGYTPMTAKVVRSTGKEESVSFTDLKKATGKKSNQIHVSGNCEMCKNRIEKAALDVNGVSTASWDVDTKLLTVDFDKTITDLKSIQLAIASIGHDTQDVLANDSTYNQLHGCCKYDRK